MLLSLPRKVFARVLEMINLLFVEVGFSLLVQVCFLVLAKSYDHIPFGALWGDTYGVQSPWSFTSGHPVSL